MNLIIVELKWFTVVFFVILNRFNYLVLNITYSEMPKVYKNVILVCLNRLTESWDLEVRTLWFQNFFIYFVEVTWKHRMLSFVLFLLSRLKLEVNQTKSIFSFSDICLPSYFFAENVLVIFYLNFIFFVAAKFLTQMWTYRLIL